MDCSRSYENKNYYSQDVFTFLFWTDMDRNSIKSSVCILNSLFTSRAQVFGFKFSPYSSKW